MNVPEVQQIVNHPDSRNASKVTLIFLHGTNDLKLVLNRATRVLPVISLQIRQITFPISRLSRRSHSQDPVDITILKLAVVAGGVG